MKTAREKILLYQLSKKKDPDAFSELYDLYVDNIFRFVFFRIPTKEQAEDITSEIFLKTWQYVISEEEKEIKNARALFYRIARNLITDFYRSRGQQQTLSLENEEIGQRAEVVADEKALDEMELTAEKIALDNALRQLKEEYREAVVLRYINDLPVGEIATILNRSKGATRVLLHRGIKALREIMKED